MELDNIYCGDALDLIDQVNVPLDLIIINPPDIAETKYNLSEYKDFLDVIYNKCANRLSKTGTLVSITTDRKMKGEIYTKHIDICNFLRGTLKLFNYKIWAKALTGNPYILNYAHILCFRKTTKNISNKIVEWNPDVLVIKRDNIKGYKNKDSFPTKLIEIIIKKFSNEQSIILDPFIGTGKTALVCKQLNRKYLGFELNKANYKLAQIVINENY